MYLLFSGELCSWNDVCFGLFIVDFYCRVNFTSVTHLYLTGFSCVNNIHEKISPCWLAESMSIIPKQCKNLKFFQCRKTKLGQKIEIECKNFKLIHWQESRERETHSWPIKSFVFKSSAPPWMAQFMAQFFPECVIRVRSFCSAIALRVRAILLVFEKIFSCLFIPNCTRNHLITYTNKILEIVWTTCVKRRSWTALNF